MSMSTGGSSAVRSSAPATEEVFDVTSAIAIVSLLRRVHQLAIDPEEKNELRDAIFAHQANGGGDPSPEMIAQFATYNLKLGTQTAPPVSAVAVTSQTPVAAIKNTNNQPTSFGRPTPRFAPVAMTSTKSTENKTDTIATTDLSPTPIDRGKNVTNVDTPETETVTETANVSSAYGSMSTDVAAVPPPVPESVADVVTQQPDSVSDIPAPVKTSTAVTEPNVTPDQVSTTDTTDVATPPPVVTDGATAATDPAERIKQIKREVNALVGNPVNLIDVNNEVGREYMNALLDAMKKVNVGDGADSVRAMSRLESAFVTVKNTLGMQLEAVRNQESAPQPTTSQTATPTETSASINEVTEEVENDIKPTPITPNDVSEEAASASTSALESVVHEESIDINESPQPPTADVSPVLESVGSATTDVAETKNVEAKEEDTVPISTKGFTAVSKERQIKDLMSEKTAAADSQAAALEARHADNPLMSPEVSNGLEQLLSEWKLFKSSGIFGTGPSGIEHPLYKQIANLTMAAVLAGRFDNANAEIKKSVADYMNGWRYEEGIAYEPGETFEHYLRRVILHILDRNKKAIAETA